MAYFSSRSDWMLDPKCSPNLQRNLDADIGDILHQLAAETQRRRSLMIKSEMEKREQANRTAQALTQYRIKTKKVYDIPQTRHKTDIPSNEHLQVRHSHSITKENSGSEVTVASHDSLSTPAKASMNQKRVSLKLSQNILSSSHGRGAYISGSELSTTKEEVPDQKSTVYDQLLWKKQAENKSNTDSDRKTYSLIDISPIGDDFLTPVFHSTRVNPFAQQMFESTIPETKAAKFLSDSNGKPSNWDVEYSVPNNDMSNMEFSLRPAHARAGFSSKFTSDSMPEYPKAMHKPNRSDINLSEFSGVKPERITVARQNFVFDYANPAIIQRRVKNECYRTSVQRQKTKKFTSKKVEKIKPKSTSLTKNCAIEMNNGFFLKMQLANENIESFWKI